MSDMLSVEDLVQLKSDQLTSVLTELGLSKWGTKAKKASRIVAKLQALKAERTEESADMIEGIEEMVEEMMGGKDVGSDNESVASVPRSESSIGNRNRGDELAEQLARLIRIEMPRQVVNRLEEAKSAPPVPSFRGADDSRYTTSEWLAIIDKFASEFNWSSYQTLRHAASRLQGAAKLWHERAGEVILNYQEWKTALQDAIPERKYSWEQKRMLLMRKQNRGESIEEYMLDKWSLGKRFGLTLDDAKEFLLTGLYQQEVAKAMVALNFTTLADVIRTAHDIERIIGHTKPFKSFDQKQDAGKSEDKIKCLKCNQIGHRKNNCKNEISCFTCKEPGHLSRECPKKKYEKVNSVKPKSPKVNLVDTEEVEDISQDPVIVGGLLTRSKSISETRLSRTALINGTEARMAVDTQSDISLIREDFVERVGGLSHPDVRIKITGITRDSMITKGMGTYDLELDGVSLQNVRLYVVPQSIMPTDLWLGKNVLEDQRISVIIHKDKVNFIPRADIGGLENIEISKMKQKCVVNSLESVVIEPGRRSVLRVKVNGFNDGNARIEASSNGVRGWTIPPSLVSIKSGESMVPVFNNSNEVVVIDRDIVVARCFSIKEDSKVQQVASEDLDGIRIGKDSTEVQKQAIIDLCRKYRNCFALNLKEIGSYPMEKMKIKLTSDSVVNEKRQLRSLAEREIVESHVKDLLEAGVIERSNSSFSSPVVIVKKKDGSIRICIDYRRLNLITVKETFPCPFIGELLEETTGWRVFSVLDMASGYYQIEMDENSKEFTSFSTNSGHYQFRRMPFGLVNAPFVFNRVMNQVLQDIPVGTLKRYMDDIIIGAPTFEQMMDKLKIAFKAISVANLKLKLSKCCFNASEVAFLGFKLSNSGVLPGDEKCKAISEYPVPTNPKQIRSFLGLCSYFRRFVAKFSVIAAPLTDLTKKNVVFIWSGRCQEAFAKLKSVLSNAPVLAVFDPRQPCEVHTDASKDGIGGVLLQVGPDGHQHPVHFVSRRTTSAEQVYHSTELELLGVVWVVTRLRMYLYGKEFVLITDCEAVRQGLQKRQLVPRIARWVLQLQEFNFRVLHRSGKLLPHVDALSRQPIQDEQVEADDMEARFTVMKIDLDSDWISAAQLKDKYCQTLINEVGKSDLPVQINNGTFKLINERIYKVVGRKSLLVVPRVLRRQLVREIHEKYGHCALDATANAVLNRFWFPDLRRCSRSVIGSCITCLSLKEPAGRKPGFLNIIERKKVPFNTIHIDHLGPMPKSSRGKKYILVAICNFTKMVFLRASATTSAKQTLQAMKSIFDYYWLPTRIVADRGTAFKNREFEEYCRGKQIELIFTSTANPRANGQVERVNRMLKPILASLCQKEDCRDWEEKLQLAAKAINSRVNSSSGKTPMEVMFGFRPRTEIDPAMAIVIDNDNEVETEIESVREEALEKIKQSQLKQKQYFDKRRCKPSQFDVNDIVVVRRRIISDPGKSQKLNSLYRGPMRIVSRIRDDLYKIASLDPKRSYECTAPSDQLKRWEIGDDSLSGSDDDAIIESSESPEL